ncbi:MAG: winged helix-turn-helix domain-containing protein [Myxococcota bacterium]
MELLHLTATSVDFSAREIHREDARISLTPTEYDLLRYFITHPNRLITQGELLENVWGLRPSTQTHTVYVTINRLRKKIESDPRRPHHILNSPGAGYRFWLASTPIAAPTLPRPRTDVFGRADDLSALTAHLSEPGVVTILGPAGMGKTRLALALLESVPFRGYFIDLTDVVDAEEIARAVAVALGCPLNTVDPEQTLLHALSYLEGALIVLDNFEQAVDAAAATLGRWRSAAPALRFVVTSRLRLGLSDEVVFDLGPLSAAAATDLFLDRARMVRATFDATAEALAPLVESLDGLPLAIELAAHRARVMGPHQLTQALDHQLQVLARGGPSLAPRHRSLRAALQGSWALLDAVAQQAFAQLSVFSAPFTLEAATHVCALNVDAWTPDVVQRLVDHSMLRFHPPDDGPPRLSMLSSIRAFASEKHTDPTATRVRHARWFARFGTPDAIEQMTRSRALQDTRLVEIEDIRSAYHTLEAVGEVSAAADTLVLLAALFSAIGPVMPATREMEGFLARQPALDSTQRRRLITALSQQYGILGRYQEGVDLIEGVLAQAPRLADRGPLYKALADLQLRQSRFTPARLSFEAAQVAFRQEGNLQGQGAVSLGLSHLALSQYATAEAEPHAEQAIDLFRAVGDQDGEALAHIALANALVWRNALAQAQTHFQAALALSTSSGRNKGRTTSKALHGLALGLAKAGQNEEAFALFEEVLLIFRHFGDILGEAGALFNYGSWKVASDAVAEGRAHLERALMLCQHVDAKRVETLTLSGLGHLEMSEGNFPTARRRFFATLALAKELNWTGIMYSDYAALASLYTRQGDLEQAQQWLDRATELEEQVDHLTVSSIVYCRRAELAKALGDQDGVLHWLSRARSLAERSGTLHSAKFQSLVQRIASDVDGA